MRKKPYNDVCERTKTNTHTITHTHNKFLPLKWMDGLTAGRMDKCIQTRAHVYIYIYTYLFTQKCVRIYIYIDII